MVPSSSTAEAAIDFTVKPTVFNKNTVSFTESQEKKWPQQFPAHDQGLAAVLRVQGKTGLF
jgi:hypothetical protein